MLKHLLATNLSMPKTIHRFIYQGLCLASALLLIIMAGIYAKNSLAGLYEKYASQYVSLWSQKPQAFSASDWQKALRYANVAYNLNPADPFNHERLGRTHEFGELNPDISNIDRIAHYKEAKTYYISALKLRPNSGWDSARLFRIKVKLGEVDDKAVEAMNNAIELAPRNNHLMLKVIFPALAVNNHQKIDELRIKATKQVLTIDVGNRHKQLHTLYKFYIREVELCRLISAQDVVSKFKKNCQDTLQKQASNNPV
jgi:tetratricopeptide (TPR) repeat protein